MAFPKPPRGSAGLTTGAGGSSKFTEQFNRLVGNRTGRPVGTRRAATPQRRSAVKKRLKSGQRARSAAISIGTSKLPKSVERSREAWFGNRGDPSGGIGAEREIKSNLEGIYDDLTSKFLRYENEQQQVQEEYVAQHEGVQAADPSQAVTPVDPDDPIAKWNAEHPGEDQLKLAVPFAETHLGTPVGKTLEYLNRPFNAVQEAMRNTLEESYNRRDAGGNENDWGHIFGDLASGAWEGLSGKRNTGAGEIYEIYKNRSAMPVAEELRELEKTDPWMEDIISKGAGFLGEVTMDPIDKFGLGRVNIARGAGRAGAVANEVTMREATSRIAGEAANNFVDEVVNTRYPNRVFIPERDAFVTHGEVNALDALTKSELSIHGGGRAGHYQVQNNAAWAQTVANRVAESQRQLVFQHFDNHLQSFMGFVDNGKRMSTAAVNTYMHMDDDFARLIDDLDTELVNKGRLPPNSSLDELLDTIGKQDRKRINNIADNIRSELDADLIKVKNDVYEQTRNAVYPTLGLRLGKKVVPVKAIGRTYNAIAQRLKGQADEVSNVSYEKMLPAILSIKAQKKRSVGVEAFEEFQKRVTEIARRYTDDEADLIHRSIEDGTNLTYDTRLQEGKEFVQQAYSEMMDKEVAAGARPDPGGTPGSQRLTNYVYVYNKKGNLKKRRVFKEERKKAVHTSKGQNRSRYGTAHAKDLGLNPVTNAYEALMYRSLKHQRDMTRALLTTDYVENFGFWANNIDAYSQNQRQISRVSQDKLPNHMREEIKDKGGSYYIPEMHSEMLNKINEMLSWNSASQMQFMREWNKVIGVLKTAMTIPAPGFHVNNMIGDAFMGLMDGVKAKDYAEVTQKAARTAAGGAPTYKIAPGIEYSHQELWSMYKADAAGGYYRVDQAGLVKPSVKGAPRQAVRKVVDKTLEAAEFREDFGRFTHYMHALREETTSRAKKGMVSDIALEQARDAALWRVNYYKFDYNALTLWERRLKTVGVPFYTFTRKVIPVLLASMFENPKYINLLSRFFQSHDGSAADNFSNWNVPGYLRMGGAAFLTDEAEPWALNLSGTPLGRLNMLQGGEAGTMNPIDPQFWRGMAKTGIEQLNPPMQAIMELGFGKEIFNEDIINQGGEWNYLLNKLPLVEDIRSEGNMIPGLRELIPGEAPFVEPGKARWDASSMLYDRLMGLGLPARPVSRGQQSQAHEDWMDRLIEDPMYKMNNSQDLFEIIPNNQPVPGGGISYQVRSQQELDENGMPAVVREFNTATEAINFVKKSLPPGYMKPSEFLELGPEGTARYTEDSRWRLQQP